LTITLDLKHYKHTLVSVLSEITICQKFNRILYRYQKSALINKVILQKNKPENLNKHFGQLPYTRANVCKFVYDFF